MKISYGRQFIDSKDTKSVVHSLSGELITQGNNILKFEKELKKYFLSKYAAVVSSGTAAMHLVAIALGWKKDDLILMSPITFLSTANIVDHLGANVDFVDIDKYTYNICPEKLEKKIKLLKNRKLKAVVATDFAGLPCDWKKLNFLSKKYKFDLINDNCHAIGAHIKNKRSYSTDFALASIHSYHPVKNITTGEGGAILSNNKKLILRIKKLRSHGIEKRGKKYPWYYDVKVPGFNYRITDFQCALGISQLKKLNIFLKKKRMIAKHYFNFFKNKPYAILPQNKFISGHAYHLFPLLINFKKISLSKSKFFEILKKKNIILQVHYIPTYKFSYFKKKYKININNFPNSENFYQNEISLPIYYSLSRQNLNMICQTIENTIKNKYK